MRVNMCQAAMNEMVEKHGTTGQGCKVQGDGVCQEDEHVPESVSV